ncbi:MAG: cytochrome c [Nitrospiraceae bacterium]|nr:cytochrome c [Nitrospiraceae bacterium]
MEKILLTWCISFLVFSGSYIFAEMGPGMMGQQGQMMESGQGEKQKSQNETAGAKIFGDNCASCHPNGGNIMAADLPLKGSRVLANFKTFLNFIRHPKMPDGSQGTMPSFARSKITDKQAKALYHFVTSI